LNWLESSSDRETLSTYYKKHGATYKELDKNSIQKYSDITALIQGYTRAIIWYTGHGMNMADEVDSSNDNFPTFSGKNI